MDISATMTSRLSVVCRKWQWLAVLVVVAPWLAAAACTAVPVLAQDMMRGADAAEDFSQWQLEEVRLRDGTVYRGLIQLQRDEGIEFAEIIRPQGKPMYAVIRPLDAAEVVSLTRLPPADRALMMQRFAQFRNRALIEAGRMDQIQLRCAEQDGVTHLEYSGSWFRLRSTANDEMTRRCIVRIEQIFRAYRQLLPPRRQGRDDLQILLFGSLDEYRDFLHRRKLDIKNPAFYSAPQNLIVAATDLSLYAQRLAQTRRRNEQLRRQYEQLDQQFESGFARLSNELRSNGLTRQEIRFERKARRAAWEREYQALLARIAETDRRNEASFAELTQRMFARLYHEAFHAYLENYVFSHRQHKVPLWLNEGLAQIFENGQLDAESLRIDAPSRSALRQLQQDISSGRPLPLADLLTARKAAFLVTHDASPSQRHYVYSWGLAYYLTFFQDLLRDEALQQYVTPTGAQRSRVERFERLVGEPLPQFEARWWQAMLQIEPPVN